MKLGHVHIDPPRELAVGQALSGKVISQVHDRDVAIAATRRSTAMLPKLQSWPSQRSTLPGTLAIISGNETMHRFLKPWREKKGLSQEQVATILGVNKSTVHRWETGARAVDLIDLEKLAKVYGVSTISLLLSPDDAALAERITKAHTILAGAETGAADRWLASGADLIRRDGA